MIRLGKLGPWVESTLERMRELDEVGTADV